MCAIIILSGCKKRVNRQSEIKTVKIASKHQNNNSTILDISKFDYSGIWFAEDYRIEEYNGFNVGVGAKLIIKKTKENNYQLELSYFSSPPAHRVSIIETNILSNMPIQSFTFEDDGWGNKGKGILIFEQDKIRINIKVEERSEIADWCIFDGEKVFIKQQQ